MATNHKRTHDRKLRYQKMLVRNLQTDRIVDNFLRIDQRTIDYRKAEFDRQHESELEMIAEFIDLNDEQIKPHIDVYCNKSGRFLYSHNNEMVRQMIKLYGVEQAGTYLKLQNQNQCCPLMLRTDTNALRMLFFKSPVEYFCYSASELISKTPDKYRQVIVANRQLSENNSIPEDSLIKANEYIRRILGLAKTEFVIEYFTERDIGLITSSSHPFNLFIAELQGCLKAIVLEQLAKSRRKLIQQQSIRITDIAEIAANYGGQRRYREQKQLHHVRDCDALQFDIESVFLEGEMDMTIHELRFNVVKDEITTPNKNMPYHIQQRLEREYKETGGIKINFTPVESNETTPGNTETKDNPFLNCLSKDKE
ncbi:MAG: hypothetical protein KAJ10_07295 [Thermodesulfovibrionia bacterium]|nr:hypothetical protein [Thermodesulfovibrionia bacterium]